jgi:uncharacterized protein (TIGR03437 family)
MTTKPVLFIFAAATLACAASPVGFQTHYISLGTQDTSIAILADSAGDIFIVSETLDAAHNPAIRVTKTDPLGNAVAVMDLGQGFKPAGAAIDAQGNVLVAGGQFIAKIDNALANITATANMAYAAGVDGVASDAAGNIYVAGVGFGDFPTTPGAYQSGGSEVSRYAFVAEYAPDLSKVLYATLYGSSSADCNPISDHCRGETGPGLPTQTVPTAIAVDASGSVLIAGYTNGASAQQSQNYPYSYGFVAKFSPGLTSLTAATSFNPPGYAGTGNETYFRAMTLDPRGNVLLVGDTGDVGPFSGTGLQPNPPSCGAPGFVMKLDGSLRNLWGTYFGCGYQGQAVDGVAVDQQSNIWITGVSQGSQLPNSASMSIAFLPFVAELSPDGSTVLNLVWSQFGGGAIANIPSGGVAALGPADSFLLPAAPGQPELLMVANSANNQSSGTIAPAELVSLYGAGIGPASPLGGEVVNGAFTNSLGGYQVLFNGVPAPLLYAGPNQFNVVSPAAIANQRTADIQVTGPAGVTPFPTVFVGAVRPQIFSRQLPYTSPLAPNAAPSLLTFATAINQDGTLNSVSNPAARGSIVTIWATGTGLTSDPSPDGSIAGSPSTVNLPVSMVVAGDTFQIPYAGQAPDAVQGLSQINFQVPADAAGGGDPFNYLVYFQLGGSATGSAFIEVTRY